MRIVQLLTQERGGPVDHAVDVATHLRQQGHESHVVTPDKDLAARLDDAGVVAHVARADHRLDVGGAREIWDALDDVSADVVHCQDRRAGLIGRLHGWRRRRPTVYTLHGVPDPLADRVPGNRRPTPRSRWVEQTNPRAERWLSRTPRSRVVTPCVALAEYATKQVGIDAGRVRVVYNGIDPTWGGAPAPGDTLVRTRTTTATWLGVMAPVKQVPALVAAVAGVDGLRLRLVGDGPERRRVEAEISAADVTERVDLVGFVSSPAAELDAADLLVLPSAAEACPMAILQAMARGLPVVATRVGGVAEVVRDGVDGLLVPTGDQRALTEALRTLHADPARREQMGEQARSRVAERFSLERCTSDLVAVYEEVVR